MAQPRVVAPIDSDYITNENFEELLNESTALAIVEGSVIRGRVINIGKELVLVDIGHKTEGRIPLKEFPPEEREELTKGDEIEVYLERIENHKGEAVVSRERAVREEAWERLEAQHKAGENVKGIIFGRVKGGYTVDLEGAVAFLPGSQVDVRPIKDISPLMGVAQPFQILKMDRRRGNIVVSRRAILEESRSVERDAALADMQEGMVVDGVVKNITDYGAFIDLGAVDGLLHVTDMSWKRISHPTEMLNLNETIKVKIIKYDRENQRISLGIKQMEDSPWQDIESKFEIGSRHKGHITNITDYGAFVELESGIEGLVHVSEMSWTKKNVNPGRLVNIGEEVEVEVLAVDPEKHRLSLGIKQCQENPWDAFVKNHKPGDKMEGEIRSITDFGLFVDLGGDLEGLVHASDISWNEDPEQALKAYKKGETVKVVILECDAEKERIGLGIKQLDGDPFDKAIGGLTKGAVSTFEVTAVQDNGIEVTVDEGVTAFIRKSDLSRDRVECRPERFSVGDRVDAKVTALDKATRTVKLSIKALEQDEQREAIANFGSADSGASLGNILGAALDTAQKEKAEEKPKSKKAPAKKKAEAKKETTEAKKS